MKRLPGWKPRSRFGATWTPALIVMDPPGVRRHRFEGLSTDEMLPQLTFGLGKAALAAGRFADAGKRFRSVTREYSHSAMAPEALYWPGVARYNGANDAAAEGDRR